ncbi:MAG: hypothetical protein D4S01_00360 [Dehalococcoidia bacterium]|nr:MAG: hypothetical protein D4S01_00360 [Dehalococcoidia bacterium]
MNHYDKKDERTGRIVAFLTRDEIDFIDSLAKDALFSTGHKLSRTDIIRAMIDAINMKYIDGKGISSKSGLERRLLSLMSITLPESLSEIKKQSQSNENS